MKRPLPLWVPVFSGISFVAVGICGLGVWLITQGAVWLGGYAIVGACLCAVLAYDTWGNS